MDAKTLAKIVQIVVQEEVGKIVRKEMATLKQQIVAEVKKSIPKQKVVREQVPVMETVDTFDIPDVLPPTPPPPPQKTYTKDNTLNSILNETVGFGGENTQQDYPTMGGAPMTSNNAMGGDVSQFRAMMAEKMGMTGMSQPGKPTVQEMIPNTTPEGMPTRTQQVPDHLAKALTRDYTDLVKAMNKK